VSSYDPPHPPWRRRSKGGSRRSSLASHPQSRRRQPRKRQPRRLTGSRQHPPRLRPACLWRCRRRPRPPHHRPQHQQGLSRRQRQRRQRHRLRRQGPNQRVPNQRGRSQRQFRVRACLVLLDRLRPPLGPASNRPPRRGPVPVPPADFLALRADADPAPHGPETTRLHPRKEWVGRVRPVPSQTALDLLVRVRLRGVLHSKAVAREFRASRDLTRR